MVAKKFHKVTSRDCEAVLYDGNNAEAVAKVWPDVVTYDEDNHDVRVRVGSSTVFLYPHTYLVRHGNEFELVKESDFENGYVEAK